MTQYNPNDFYPASGAKIDSQGNVRNTADGFNADGSENVVLENRNVKEIQFHNGVAITDTSNHDVQLDVSGYGGRKMIIVYNGLNQAATVSVIARDKTGTYGSTIGAGVSCAAGGGTIISSSNMSALADPISNMTIRVTCATAPTSGTISTWLEVNPI